jgi:hypothetical protein
MHANLTTKYAEMAGHYSGMYPDQYQPHCLCKGVIHTFFS